MLSAFFHKFILLDPTNTKIQSRILNGKEIERNSMPWLVDVGGDCTGFLIGKKHFLTAMHCYKVLKFKFVYIGSHDRSSAENDHCEKFEVDSVIGIGRDGKNIKPSEFTSKDGIYSSPDIAIVTLKKEIQFSATINKAILDPPSRLWDSCQSCGGICAAKNKHSFLATGWGLYKLSKIPDVYIHVYMYIYIYIYILV